MGPSETIYLTAMLQLLPWVVISVLASCGALVFSFLSWRAVADFRRNQRDKNRLIDDYQRNAQSKLDTLLGHFDDVTGSGR